MQVSGDYEYFKYEIYADSGGKKHELRDSGTSYENSYLYTDGSDISNIVFYAIPYNTDGVAGKTVSLEYSGPNVKRPANSKPALTSCTKYGQINAPGGGPINGYTTSYIVKGGSYSCERVDLMDKWHVTAVSCYITATGTVYYELYDTDDNDYYGWVEDYHINFY